MSDNSMGEKLRVTIFGQSHGPAVGCVVEGFPAGFAVDREALAAFMERRAPGRGDLASARKEDDLPEIISGLNEEGLSCGAPICAVIKNKDARPGDYPDLRLLPRPGHADFAALRKYGPPWDYRGGGQFSARLTAPLCFAGALCLQWLKTKGVSVSAHIARVGGVCDAAPDPVRPSLPLCPAGSFPVIDQKKGEAMKAEILAAKEAGNSIGGEVRCLVTGFPAGLGGPLFGGLEGRLAQALFAVPAVKGLSFGETKDLGSENNDPFVIEPALPFGVGTSTNNSGGILGGISTGMPLVFTVSFKPTPSVALPQRTVDLKEMKETVLTLKGRHDPCVVPRAVPVVEAAAAIVLTDLML